MAGIKKFHIGDILSVTTGALLSNRGMDGIYDVVGHIADNKHLNQISLVANADAARELLHEQLPWTKEVKFPELPKGITKEEVQKTVNSFVNEAAKKYGEYHEVGQLAQRPEAGLQADISFLEKLRSGGRSEAGKQR